MKTRLNAGRVFAQNFLSFHHMHTNLQNLYPLMFLYEYYTITNYQYHLNYFFTSSLQKQSNRRLEETNLMDEIEEPRKVGLVRVDFWPDDITPLFVLSQIMAESKMTTTTHSTHKRQLQQSSAPNIRAAEIVSGMLDTIEQRASSRMNKYGRSSEYCLPRVHGTLPSPNKAKPEFINNALRTYFQSFIQRL